MIIFQLLIFVVSIVLLSLSISGYGRIANLDIKKNFFLDIFLGFILISLIITVIHFFFKINLIVSVLIFVLGLYLFFYKKKLSAIEFIKIDNIYYIIIVLFLIPIFLSQKYHEDFGYYHLPYAIGFIEEKIIFGFANIEKTFVYNSIWLNLYSIFFLNDQNFNFLTLPSFLLFLNFILFSLHQLILKNEKLISDYFLLISLFYFLLKFTRISEFGVDLPAAIFSILTIYYFLKFSETELTTYKREYFFLVVFFSIFSILIKLSTIPIILLPTFLYIKYFKDMKFYIFKYKFCIVYILLITFFIQQFIYTGCLFFPSNATCFGVSWFSEDNISVSNQLELINKSYSEAKNTLTPNEFLKNFNWFNYWFKRNFTEILEHLLTMTMPVLLFLFFQKKKINNKFIFNDKLGLYLFLILGLIFWLNFSPVYRFAIYLFITLVYVLLINSLILRYFSKKIFIIFFMIFIFFNFSKNIMRLIKVESIFFGVLKIENQYILNNSNTEQIRKIFKPDIKKNSINGWQGRLCWNIPFICSYNSLEIKKKYGYLIINKLIN